MERKHTPGPWQVARKVSNYVVARDGLDIIANCDTMNEARRAIEDANARLIAAAPELLEALEDAEFLLRKAGQISGPMQDSFKRSAEDARVAIAKAKGE